MKKESGARGYIIYKKILLNFLSNQSKTIAGAALLLAFLALLSRVVGFFRNAALSSQFGAGESLDIYFAAFRIPDFIFAIIVVGALSAGFIPALAESFKKSSEEAWRLASDVLNIIVVAAGLISVCFIIFAPQIVPLVVPGFSGEKLEAAIFLSRIMFLQPVLLAISSVFTGILQARSHFFATALAPIFYNIGIIVGIFFFVPYLGLVGLAWGVVLGAALHVLIQAPAIYYSGFRYKFLIDFSSSKIRQIGSMMVPRTLGLIIIQLNLFLMTILASRMSEGSLAIFNFANDLQNFPIGIIALSFAVASFPSLAVFAASNNKEEFIESFSLTLRQILLFLIPATVLFIVLRAQIVRTTLGYGEFDWEDTILTIQTLAFFSVGIVSQGVTYLLIRTFFALKDSWTPFLVGIASFIINIILALKLGALLGVAGLALAFSLAASFGAIALFVILFLRLGELDERALFWAALKFNVAALIAGGAAYGFLQLAVLFLDTRTAPGIFMQGVLAGGIGMLVYFACLFVFRSQEAFDLKDWIKARVWRQAGPPAEI